ncbi:hypothetical protein EXN66_Car010857 [Channa argus]|uniref:Uncharacterized protein n=1 Tax=Channa argus TaxID=215402 RepID=A0A6G1PXW6_CHAAH|nr:hypothetical protein EXN66_Car010857 [Channa argus]
MFPLGIHTGDNQQAKKLESEKERGTNSWEYVGGSLLLHSQYQDRSWSTCDSLTVQSICLLL